MSMKKIISLILSVMMLLTGIPVTAMETTSVQDEIPTICISSTDGRTGGIASVDISLKNNPGVAIMIFDVQYDSTALSVENVVFNKDFGGETGVSSITQNPLTISYDNTENQSEDIVFATINFLVKANARVGSSAKISINYDDNNIIDIDENAVDFEIEDGIVSILNGVPGDINSDESVNGIDLLRMRKYFVKYDVEYDPIAMDVTGDKATNALDLLRFRKYFVNKDTEIFYGTKSSKLVVHEVEKIAATEPICTEDGNIEYWYCSDCGKYFEDQAATIEITLSDTIIEAKGHTEEVVPGYEATTEEEGLTDGIKCSVCNTVLIEQQVIEKLATDYYAITYRNDKGAVISDEYRSYASHLGMELPTKDDISVKGYNFQGWYTEENGKGTRVYEIEAGTTGKVTVHGYWTPSTYQIVYTGVPEDFDNNIHEYNIESNNIYLSQNPDWKYLIFTGWEESSGKLVYTEQGIPMIKAGTTGDIFLNATWKTMENIFTVAEKQYSKAAFNEEDGKYYFFYHLGNLDNVILNKGEKKPHYGMNTTITTSKTVSFSKELAKGYAESISNATKTSFEATLSSEVTASLSTTIGASATAGATVDGLFAKGTASATASTEVTAGATWSTEVGISSSAENETTESKEASSTISYMSESTFTEEETRTLTEDDPRGNYYNATAGEFEIYSVVVYDPIENELQYDVYSKHIDTFPMTYFEPLSPDVKVATEFDGIPYKVYEDEIEKTITESFFVFYDAGHEDVVVDENNERVTDVFKLNASGNLPENNFYTRSGYVFDGWELRDAQGNLLAEKIEDGAPISLLAQYANDYECRVLQLTARWKIKTVMKITLNDQVGDTAATPNVVFAHVNKGMFADAAGETPISEITPPTKKGYIFGGYFVNVENNTFENAEGRICIINPDGTFSDIMANGYSYFADDSTIYALWIQGNAVTVKFNLNTTSNQSDSFKCYSSVSPSNISDRTVYYGSKYNKDGSLPIPTAFGYSFDGWWTSATGGSQITDDTVVKLTENQELFAHWTKTKSEYTYVKTSTDFEKIGTSGNYYIVADITLSGTWTPISSFSNGTIDGGNHTISKLTSNATGITTATSYGFIVTLNSNATVKDIKFNDVTLTADYSGYDCDKDVAMGCVAAINRGTISNVHVTGATIKIDSVGSTSENNAKRHYANVGGICGYNYGTINGECTVNDVTIYAHSRISKGVGYAYAGGVAGCHRAGTITNVTVSNYNVQSFVRSADGQSAGKLVSGAGGIVGAWMDGASLTSTTLSGSQYILADYDGDAYPRTRYYYGSYGPDKVSGSWTYGYKGSGFDY